MKTCDQFPSFNYFNPLNAELYPITHLLTLLGANPILHVGRIMVNLVLNVMMAFQAKTCC